MRAVTDFCMETWTWYQGRRALRAAGSRRRAIQGYLLSYELTPEFLKLRLLRCLTLSRIRIERIQCLMSSGGGDGLNRPFRALSRMIRSRYWPVVSFPVRKRRTYPYALVTKKNRRILLTLNPGFHYRLRMAISAKQAAAQKLAKAA